MFEKILVALDRSSEATAVFDFALSVAKSKSHDRLFDRKTSPCHLEKPQELISEVTEPDLPVLTDVPSIKKPHQASVAAATVEEMLLLHFIDWQMQDVSPWIGLGTLYDVDLSGERFDLSHQHLQQEIERSQSWLATYAQKAIYQGLNCQTECRVGNCNIGIVDRAKQWGADLIVIGRRGHKNISEMLLGSVSNYVIHHAPCSVSIVQGSKNLTEG